MYGVKLEDTTINSVWPGKMKLFQVNFLNHIHQYNRRLFHLSRFKLKHPSPPNIHSDNPYTLNKFESWRGPFKLLKGTFQYH